MRGRPGRGSGRRSVSCCLGSLAAVVRRVTVSEAKVELAHVADAGHQLLLLAPVLVALVGEDPGLGAGLAIVLDVLGHGEVGDGAPGHGDGLATQGTHGDLQHNLLL